MAGWSEEVVSGKMLARTILDLPIVFFRDEDGKIGGLFDRCPHRFAPLSMGALSAGKMTCGYHGLSFDKQGICVSNPHGPIGEALSVRYFIVHEAHHAIWIWMGEPELSDPASIVDLTFLTDCPESALSKGYLASYGHYQLYVDNILDLSHTDYLHPTTLGGGAMTRSTAKVHQEADSVTITWESLNDRASPLLDSLLPDPGQPADVWAEVRWSPPGVMILRSGAKPAGGARESGVASRNVHILTPETMTSSHYFFAATRDFRTDDTELNALIALQRAKIFSTEDKPMIEAQQRRMGDADFWALKPALLKIDHAPVIVRRLMDRLIKSETSSL